MSPTGSCVGTLAPQLLVMVLKAGGCQGGGAAVCHKGLAFEGCQSTCSSQGSLLPDRRDSTTVSAFPVLSDRNLSESTSQNHLAP